MMRQIFSLMLALIFCLPVWAQKNSFDWEDNDSKSETARPAVKQELDREQEPQAQSLSATEGSLDGKVSVNSAKKAPMLYGRIDQIAAQGNVSMPSLKIEIPKLDKEEKAPLSAQVSESRFSGHVTSSFPLDFSGNWGGSLKVWRFSTSPASMQRDAAETEKLQKILQVGRDGTVNFSFQHAGGNIDLQPTVVKMMIPASESYGASQLQGQMGMNSQMMAMVSSAMANTQIPVFLHFGDVSTANSNEVGVSGNQIEQTVVKNEIRQLSSNVVEQQIVTRDVSVLKQGGRRDGYTESDIRFTQQSSGALYVLAASVDYGSQGEFLRKLIMYGNVYKGNVMDTSPSSYNLSSMMSQVLRGSGNGSLGTGYGSPNMSQLGNLMSRYGGNAGGGQYPSSSANANNMGSYLQGFSQVINSLNAMPNQ